MHIYNITFMVDFGHADSLLTWLGSDGIRVLTDDPMLSNPRLMRIADPANPEGVGLALQLDADASVDSIRAWEPCALPGIFGGWLPDWQRYMVYFTTIMQPLEV